MPWAVRLSATLAAPHRAVAHTTQVTSGLILVVTVAGTTDAFLVIAKPS